MNEKFIKKEFKFKEMTENAFWRLNPELKEQVVNSQSKEYEWGEDTNEQLLLAFHAKAEVLWSWVFWRVKKELEQGIEVLLNHYIRCWETKEKFLVCSVISKDFPPTFVLSENKKIGKITLYFENYYLILKYKVDYKN